MVISGKQWETVALILMAISGNHLDEPARVRPDPLRAAEGGIGMIPLWVALDVWEQTRPLCPEEDPLLVAVAAPAVGGHPRHQRGNQRQLEAIRGN